MGGGSSQKPNITPLQMPGAQQFNPFAPPQQQPPVQIPTTTAMNPIYQGGIQQPNSQNQILQQLLAQFTGGF